MVHVYTDANLFWGGRTLSLIKDFNKIFSGHRNAYGTYEI
ncbi:unnamed protein product, partial [marine sediment metagenome]